MNEKCRVSNSNNYCHELAHDAEVMLTEAREAGKKWWRNYKSFLLRVYISKPAVIEDIRALNAA